MALHNGVSNGPTYGSKDNISNPDVICQPIQPEAHFSYRTRYFTVAILFIVNLLNYMDRYTIAGVLIDVQDYYHIGDRESGLLQASFVIGFILAAPVFGYAGDRYNRKWLMVVGIGLWSAVTLAGSFVPPEYFWLFVLLRGIVGVGEASYVTIAPTLISDMFVKQQRSNMLMIFYFAIPVGSGLGYIVGANVAESLGGWEWSLRVTPGLGVLCCLLIAIVTREPPRGMAEDGASHHSNTTFLHDMKYLAKNKTFVLSSLGNTCVTFVAGSLAFFAPKFLLNAYRVSGNLTIDLSIVSLYTGLITVAAGLVGVASGTIVAKYVKRVHMNGDPIVCAMGLLVSAPFLYCGLVVCQYNMIIAWILICIGQTALCMNWSLVADILLYTVPPTLRSSAEAVQLFVCHLLGDAASPFILGAMSQALQGDRDDTLSEFKSLQNSLFLSLFITVLGGGFFLFCSLYVVKDKMEAEATTKGTASRQSQAIHRRTQQTLPLDDMIPLMDDDDDDDEEILPHLVIMSSS